ncbi:uncharacterized protein MYCFIDRAFT_135158 [Pseudocercospora fijiensis CIRAD86]|uniref:Dihydrofolate reductase n=1 Tax=Pseudocercospora fijiensis (strain CIRAD86) TaxID=383855 RepID=M3B5N4_PSEFD|nr:uncharacterized protein MYCFIDRAFT_135158 [Pseudocercospora fijiensis CIRAD86]EME84672.1 hypothetical protein MYCFIDRAFT_135158 [Pseudocercospora fijiensis CIRAD86]
MSLSQLPLTIIVAATAKNGIGKNNGLPWPMLKKDMAFFARVTKRSILSGASRNVVIMGRKTWESIPPKRRPLADRTNIVISSQDHSQLDGVSDDVVVASDILSGLRSLELSIRDGRALPAGRIFVIGGSSIYKSALELPQTNRILLTRIGKEYDCDTFFPTKLDDAAPKASAWQRADHAALVDFVGEAIEEGPHPQSVGDEEVTLDFQLYQRT